MSARDPGALVPRRAWGLAIAVTGLFLFSALVVAAAPPSNSTPPVTGESSFTAAQVPLAPGADFSTYLGNAERTSSVNSEQMIVPSTVSSLHLLWSFNARQPVQSQPVEQNGTVYFGAKNGYEYAVWATNGTLRWRTFLGQSRNDTVCGNVLGVTSTATVSGSTLYVEGGYPYFDALNTSTGALEWQLPIGTGGSAQGFYQWSSPLIYDGRAYVGIASDCDQPLVQAGVDMYSLANRSLIGYFDTSVPKPNGSSIWGSPSLDPATNQVFVATGNQYKLVETKYSDSVIALNATTLKVDSFWQIPVSEQRGDGDFGVTPTQFTPPGGYPMVTAANKNGILYALYQSNMSIAWEQPICCEVGSQDEHISTAYGDGEVYAVGSLTTINGTMYNSSVIAIDPLTGAYDWQVGFPQTSYYGYAAPLYVNHMLVVADEGSLMVLNATTGSLMWETNVSGVIQAAPSIARGELYASSSSGMVYAFDTTLNATDVDNAPVGISSQTQTFNVSVSGGLPPYSYSWNFGDGGTATGATPTHTFLQPGSYNVSVTVSDLGGNSSVTNETVSVGPWSNVTFVESGLPSGAPWSVEFDRNSVSSTGGSISLNASNGTHTFRISGPVAYAPVMPTGTIHVQGAPLEVNVTFEPGIAVQFVESGLALGTNWSLRFNGVHAAVSGTTTTFYALAGAYNYSLDPVAGYNATPSAGSVTVNSTNVTVGINFQLVNYSVDFNEVGLAPGDLWSITFDGSTVSSTTSVISFSATDGLYPFTVPPVPGFFAAPMKGKIHLHGSGTSETVEFVTVYSVQFVEHGLPAGTLWNVTLDTTTMSSTTDTIQFYEPNGSYTFEVGAISGWQTSQSGQVRVLGGPKIVAKSFVPGGYFVTFQETGLTAGTNWSATVGTVTQSGTSNLLHFTLLDGTYSYSVPNIAGYTRSNGTGSITVNGTGFTVTVPFTPVRYALTFKETGLPAVKNWSVTVGADTVYSTTNTVVFHLTNGTYAFTVGAPAGYTTTLAGSVTVSGAPLTEAVSFHAIRYTLTVVEEGLAAPRSWQVAFGTMSHVSTGTRMTFLVTDGTYAYTATTTAGNFTAPSGNFTISGQNLTITVVFTQSGAVARESGSGGALLTGDQRNSDQGRTRAMACGSRPVLPLGASEANSRTSRELT